MASTQSRRYKSALMLTANGSAPPTAPQHPMPYIGRGLIVQLMEDATYTVHPVHLTDALWDAVKALSAYARWYAYARGNAFGTTWTPTQDEEKLNGSAWPADPQDAREEREKERHK